MEWLLDLVGVLAEQSITVLVLLVGIGALGLAAFAIYAVLRIAVGSGK